jgi:hypothetical protein
MAQQTINLGTVADDGTGDTLRDGGDKINDNFTELYADKLDKSGGTMTGDLIVPDEAYDATAWNGSLEVPTKNAVRDKIESLGGGATTLDGLTDVNAPTPGNGEVLTWDSTPGEWISAAPAGGTFALDDATDVDTTGVADGDVLTFDSGSGDWVAAAPSGGAGALVLLEQHTASASASLDFTTAISATYDEYLIEIVGLVPATNGVSLYMRMSTDGGATYDSSGIYDYTVFGRHRLGSSLTGSSTSTYIQMNQSGLPNTSTKPFSGHVQLFSPGSTALHKSMQGHAAYHNGTCAEVSEYVGQYLSTTAVNAFRFLMSAGNIASGTIRVYGIAK